VKNYAKKEIPFTFERPKKIPSIFQSGDLEEYKPIDVTRPILKYEGCKNLDKLDPITKKLISVEYNSQKDILRLQKEKLVALVRRHPADTVSTEAKIAAATAKIRYLQDTMRKYPRDVITKVVLKELIDARKKKLKKLRMVDIKKFEWILDTLKITFHPPPMFYHGITRKGTIRKMAREHCNELRRKKIDAYKAKLKAMQAEFLKEKQETLQWIDSEKKNLGITDDKQL